MRAIVTYDREQAHPIIAAALMVDHAEASERGLTWDAHAAATAVLDALEDQRAIERSSDDRQDSLLPTDRANFDTLVRAFENDDVALLHARERASGEAHALLCIMSDPGDGSEDVDVIPVARMLDGDPTEAYEDPQDG